jgi:hypothetical protein
MNHETPDWFTKPFRILDFAFNSIIDTIEVEEIVEYCRTMHADVIHFHCQDNMHGGFDEEGIYFKSRCSKKSNRDLLGEFLPAAKEAGIRTVVYVNLHWYTLAFASLYPEWQVIRRDGTPLTGLYGDDDSTFCINSPWRDWSFALLEDLCEYPIDGIFFDGPITFATRGGCFCEHCRRKWEREGYEKRLGRPFPTPEEANADNGRCFRDFHVESMVDYYRDAVATIRRSRPGTVAYGNYANVSESDYSAGRNNRRLIPEMDGLLAEGGFMYGRPDLRSFFKTGASSRLYETQAEAKPACNAVSMAYSPWRWVSLSPAETAVLVSQASIGVNPYYAVFYQGKNAPGPAAAARRFAFLERNRELLAPTRSAASVALLQSEATLNSYAGVDIPWADLSYQKEVRAAAIGNFSRSFYGFYEMLVRARIPFDVIDEEAILSGRSDRYASLILPNCACLSDAVCERISRFALEGGAVVADFETSCYDENGRRRRTPALADLFGIEATDHLSDHRRWDYVFPTGEGDDLFARAFGSSPCPAPRRNLGVRATDGQVLAHFSRPIVSNIVASAAVSDEPFLIRRRAGKGMSSYLPTQFGEFFNDSRPERYPELLALLLDTGRAPVVKLSGAPNLLELRPRISADGTALIVHLVNLEVGPIERVVPARDITVTVEGMRFTRCRALEADRALPLRVTGSGVEATLESMEEFEALLFSR